MVVHFNLYLIIWFPFSQVWCRRQLCNDLCGTFGQADDNFVLKKCWIFERSVSGKCPSGLRHKFGTLHTQR